MDPLTNPLPRLAPVQEPDPTTAAPATAQGEDGFVDPQVFFTPDRRQKAYPNPLNPPDPEGFQDPAEFYKPPDKGFTDALKEVGWSEVPFVGQVVDGARMVKLWDAAKAMEAGNPSEEQLKIVAEFLEEGRRDTGIGYTVGKILTALPAYAIEFIAGGEVAGRLGTTTGLKGMGLALQQALRKTAMDVGGVAARRLTRVAAKGVEIAAKSAVQTATMPGRILDAGIQRALADKLGITGDREQLVIQGSLPNLVETLPQGVLDMWIENVSEHSGGMVPPEASLNQLAAKIIDRYVQTVPNATVEKALEKIASKTGWHGVLAEMGEERVGAAMRAILLGDPWSDVIPSAKQAAAEAIAFAAPGAAGAVAARVMPEPRATETTKLEPGQSLDQGPPTMTESGAAPVREPDGSATGSRTAPGAPVGWDEVGPAEEEAARAPHVQADMAGVDEEAQRAAATLVHANSKAAGSEVDPNGARIVEPRGPIQEWARDFLQQRGVPTAFVDVGGRQLQLGAVFNGYAIALDANTGADNTLRATVFHETAHAVRRYRRQSWGRFYADVRAADPEGLDQAEAEYASDIKTTLGTTLDSEQTQNEGLSRYIESMAGYVELAFRDPQRLVRLATKNPGLFQSILDAIVTTVNRMIGTNLPTAIERQLKKFQAEARALTPNVGIRKTSDRATEIDAQRAAQIALKLRALLNETVGVKAEARAAPVDGEAPKAAPREPEGAPNAEPGEPTVPRNTERDQDSAGVVGSPPAESIAQSAQPAQPTKGRLIPTRGPNGELVWRTEPVTESEVPLEKGAPASEESGNGPGPNDGARGAEGAAAEPAGAAEAVGEPEAGARRPGKRRLRPVRADDERSGEEGTAAQDVQPEGAAPEQRREHGEGDRHAEPRGDGGQPGDGLEDLVNAEIERQLAGAEPEPEPVRQKPLPPPDAAAIVGKPKRLRAKRPAPHPITPPALEAKKPEVMSPFVERKPVEQPVRDEEWTRKAKMFMTNIHLYLLKAEDYRKQAKTSWYLDYFDRAAANAWDLYQHLGITEVSESDDAHLRDAKRSFEKAGASIQDAVEQWRRHLEQIKAAQSKLEALKPEPPPAAKSDLDRALDQLLDEFNVAPPGVDEAKYARVKGAFDVVAKNLGSDAKEPLPLVRALVSFLMAQKLPAEKVRAMQPYLVRYAREVLAKPEPPVEALEKPHTENYRITEADQVGKGPWRQRARQNLEAIKILKDVQKTGRPILPSEKRALVLYVGWGASELANNMFADPRTGKIRKGWEKEAEELRNLVEPGEYDAMRASTLNAHYTSPDVIRAMYVGLQRLGFTHGSFLEPGLGVGHFIGLMPEDLAARSTYTGIELDPITAGIAKLLYPKADIRSQGYEEFQAPRDTFDVGIGNPPFAKITVLSDDEYRKAKLSLHDFFFVKTLDRVRPGGIVMFVTSRFTMDKENDKSRALMAERAELLGAVRLPQTAFLENAGTEVVTDILILRRKKLGQESKGQPWANVVSVETPEGPTLVNEYYAQHPEMVLGQHRLTGTMYRAGQYTVEPDKSRPIAEQVREAMLRLPEGVYTAAGTTDQSEAKPPLNLVGDASITDRSFHVTKGKLWQRRDGVDVDVAAEGEVSEKDMAVLRSYAPLRDAVLEVFRSQVEGVGDFDEALAKVNKVYDAFVEKHGPINLTTVTETSRLSKKTGKAITIVRQPNLSALWEDPNVYRVAAIEDWDEENLKASKGRFFRERTVVPQVEPVVTSAADALNVSLNQLGKLDINHMAAMLNRDPASVIDELGDAVYQDPGDESWQEAGQYLSGNVRVKLAAARARAERDSSFQRNVKALEAVQPKDLVAEQIKVQFGQHWIPARDIQAFVEHLGLRENVNYYPDANLWSVSDYGKGYAIQTSKWGTIDYPASHLLRDLLNNRSIKVMVQVTNANGGKSMVLEPVATTEANQKANELREEMEKWLWSDDERRERLVKDYNERFNAVVPRRFDGKHLTMPGMSGAFTLRKHQKNVVWRIIQTGNTYMAHGVGAGKTLAMAAAAMELRRLGLARKPMFVVPNHMLAQFARETLQAYPQASIMVADEKNFHKDRRRTFVARAATGSWDAIFITQSAFEKVRAPINEVADFIQEQIEAMTAAMIEAKRGHDRFAVKDLERRRKTLEERLAALTEQSKKDPGVLFSDMGVDFLFVDEAHAYRRLDFYTSRGNVKGISSAGSNRSLDFFIKSRMLNRKNPGRALVMASGTPITNTMGELYTIQRYLQSHVLEQLGMESFDAWAANFGSMRTTFEIDPGNRMRAVERFGQFRNVPELQRITSEVMDFVHVKDLTYIQRPEMHVRDIMVEASDEQRAAQQEMAHALDHATGPEKGSIGLKILTDARYLALDPRFRLSSLNRAATDSEPSRQSKIDRCVEEVAKTWREGTGVELEETLAGVSKKVRGDLTQMIFVDLGVSGSRGFSINEYLRRRLVAEGIPRDQIAFIQEYEKAEDKLKLFRAMNTGRVRVLIGSTPMMGTGVNAQRLLKAVHHLSIPWLPADMEQRDGRVWRQKNLNKDVESVRYSTMPSYDAKLWGALSSKQYQIEQFLRGDLELREVEDLDGDASVYAQAKAAATGDPRIMEFVELDTELTRLRVLRQAHLRNQGEMRTRIGREKGTAREADHLAERVRAWMKRLGPLKWEEFSGTVMGQKVSGDDAEAAIKGITERLKAKWTTENQGVKGYDQKTIQERVGEFAGVDLWAKVGTRWANGTAYPVLGEMEGHFEDNQRTLTWVNTFSWRGIFNTLSGLEARAKSLEDEAANARDQIKVLEAEMARPFAKEEALERMAKRHAELEKILAELEKGQPAPVDAVAAPELGKDETDEDAEEYAINAWHGSPHQFDEFDHSHMGRGEGNQSFGWGTYLADSRELAEHYRYKAAYLHLTRRLAEESTDPENYEQSVDDIFNKIEWQPKELTFWKGLRDNDWLGFDLPYRAVGAALLDKLENFDPTPELQAARRALGALYRVSVDADREHFLDLDKSFREQSAHVKAAINGITERTVLAMGYDQPLARRAAGNAAVAELETISMRHWFFRFEAMMGARHAATILRRSGISGNVYLDARSRKAGEGNSNWVVFDDEKLKIEEQFAIGPKITAAVAKRIRKFAGKAEAEGETTSVGTRPNPVAMTHDDPAVRAFSRGVYEERADTADAERQPQAKVREEALAQYEQDPDGTRRRILRTIDRGGTLDAWDMVTAQRFATDDAVNALATGDPRQFRDAAKVLWMYRNAGRDTARSLAIRRGVPARTAKEQLAELITTPEQKIREELDDLEDRRRAPGVSDEEVDRLTEEIGRKLEAQAKLWTKAADKLRKMGIDPQLVTEDYYEDLVTLGRLIRTVRAGASSKWDWFIEYRLASMLSGPATQVANITGNAGNLVLHQGMYRLAETLTNTLVGSKDAPTWGETLYFIRSWLPEVLKSFGVLARAFASELPVFEMDLKKRGAILGLVGSKVDALRGPAIPGILGRIIRAPSLTALLAFDEFFKSIVATTEAHALAYRLAKSEKLSGPAMEKRIREVLDTGAHPIHLQGLLKARTVTFQEEGGELVQAGLGVRRALNHMFGGVPVGSMLLPFIQTPGAIFKAGLSVPFYPLIAVRNAVSGNWRGNRAKANEDVARSLVAFATVVGIWAMVGGSGGDDDDKLPLVSGSSPRGRGERDLANRTVPAYSVRVGDSWFSYRRLDPASVSLASLVDMINTLNSYEEGGDQASFTDALGRVLTSVADQAADKTYLQTLGDLYRIVVANDAGKAALPRLVRDTLILPLVPNIVRQPTLKLDDSIRVSQDRRYEDKGVWEASAAALPHLAAVPGVPPPPPRYDVWGREVRRADSDSSSFWRLVSPWPKVQERPNVDPLDLWIVEYNRRVEKGDFGEDAKPLYPAPVPYWYRGKGGKTLYWSDAEYELLQRESGRRAHERLSNLGLDPENPRERDRKRIEDALADARRFVRNRLLRERRADASTVPAEVPR